MALTKWRENAKTENKQKQMPWAKGQSGNAGGRPKEVAEVRKLALRHCPDAIKKLRRLMDNNNGMVSARACEAMLDRGLGRPAQLIGEDPENKFAQIEDLPTATLKAMLAESLAKGGK